MSDQPIKHGMQHRWNAPDNIKAGQYEIKVFPDEAMAALMELDLPVEVGDDLFVFTVPEDLDRCRLVRAEAFVTTVDSANIAVAVRNRTSVQDMLATNPVIQAGEFTSETGTLAVVAAFPDNQVMWSDVIAIDVLSAGGDGWGLGVILEFSL